MASLPAESDRHRVLEVGGELGGSSTAVVTPSTGGGKPATASRPSPTPLSPRRGQPAAGLPPPVDGVTTAVDDPTQLAADLEDAVSIGFGGKLAIHPRQVAAINHAFTPAPTLVSWAERVVAATFPNVAHRDDQSGEPAEVTVGSRP